MVTARKWMATAALASLLVPLLGGCTDHNAIKQSVQQAIAKQKEMKTYKFSGSASLNLGAGLPVDGGNPMTAAVLGSLKDSTIEWSGVSSVEPVRLEADVKVTPKGSSTPFTLPFLIKDNKMYVSLPLINKPDEFYAIDLAQLGQGGGTPLSADNLKNTPQVTSAIWSAFADAIDAKWFEQAKDPVTLPDGKPAKSYTIAVNDKNAAEINAAVSAKLPEIAGLLQTNGLVSADQAAKWKAAKGYIELQPPSKLTLLVDDQGFVRDEKLELTYKLTGADGKTSNNQTTLHEAYEQINQAPQFQKDAPAPAKTKPFDDVLKLLKPKK
ncbi:hypothetical protein SD70_05005 [Gordoniibacillus kamchatkensis]|uniref:Lipoprotein n=1 Tax=Gordoniibacillus kamchatkensis TaxID=1590651 RepID=A0ABR5AL30_9BACL|nr:hypothetical protein [Paenibacillus sp. VKM B-2647]KIL41731.1 hypothetical protein SD70_05005 [Paenibacillus sp. VKM B-2647]